jgi:hypothetical protein
MSEVVQIFAAEELLFESHIFTRLKNLQASMRYETGGEQISFDDFYGRLKTEVDNIPSIRLEIDIAPHTEQQYSLQLITSLEKIVDDCDRVSRKVMNFFAKLKAAKQRIEEEKTTFASWYILAANDLISARKIKFPAAQVKALADSEFTRLVGDLNIEIDTLLLEVEVLKNEVKMHKSTQREKFDVGKEQINASWTSHIPSFASAVSSERSDQLLQYPAEEEEEYDEAPSFVSKVHGKVIQTNNPNAFPPEMKVDVFATIVPEDDGTLPVNLNVEGHEIKGVFKKTGDPQPINQAHAIHAAKEKVERLFDLEETNFPHLGSTLNSPRKRLVIDDDIDEII